MNPSETTHILIAEDNPGDVRLIRLALEETKDWTTTITVAGDGAQAIALLEASAAKMSESSGPDLGKTEPSRPDLVILDFNLPKRSGTDVLRAIRQSERLKRMPVVVLSSSPEYFLRERMKDAEVEANCYMTKPPDFDEFLQLGERIRGCYRAGLRSAG
jgi:CheY-like chemotaxis protein